jgi:hypothetical protein
MRRTQHEGYTECRYNREHVSYKHNSNCSNDGSTVTMVNKVMNCYNNNNNNNNNNVLLRTGHEGPQGE